MVAATAFGHSPTDGENNHPQHDENQGQCHPAALEPDSQPLRTEHLYPSNTEKSQQGNSLKCDQSARLRGSQFE